MSEENVSDIKLCRSKWTENYFGHILCRCKICLKICRQICQTYYAVTTLAVYSFIQCGNSGYAGYPIR